MPARIIIADDEPLQRMDLKDVLTRRGYLVVGEATDGLEIVPLVRAQQPDLVIMDIRMPGMDGIMVAETLVREKIAPVLLLTAYTDQELVLRARDVGVINYLVKPLHESEVVPAVEMALSRHQQMSAMEERIRLLTEELEAQTLVERSKGLLMEKQSLIESETLRKLQKVSPVQSRPIQEDVETVLSELQQLQRGHLAIAASPFVHTCVLSFLMEHYKPLYPNIEVSFSPLAPLLGLKKLEAHEIELFFLEKSIVHPGLVERTWRQEKRLISIMYSREVQLSRAAQALLNLLTE